MDKVAVAKSGRLYQNFPLLPTLDFQKWTKWQWQKGAGSTKVFHFFAMSLFATLSISTPDFQKWTKWQVAKSGPPLISQ